MTLLQPNQEALTRLRALGFSDIINPVPQRLICKVAGREKSGKSHLALTGQPPIIYFSIDIGTEGVVEKFQAKGTQVLVHEIRLKKGGNPQDYKDAWKKLDEALDVAIQVGTGTIVFDTWTEVYELARLNYFGGRLEKVTPNEYPVVYSDLREKIRRIYDKGTMNAVLLTKLTRVYQSKELEESGFKDTGFLVQANLETNRLEIPNQQGATQGTQTRSIFTVKVNECRQNPKLNGMTFASEMPKPDGSGGVEDKFNLTYITWLVHNWV